MRMKATGPRSETEVIRLEIAKEDKSLTRLAASHGACIEAWAKRLCNQLAPGELKHLLTPASQLGSLADDRPARSDAMPPILKHPQPLRETEEHFLRPSMEEKRRSQDLFGQPAQRVDREELLVLLETLRVDEEDHRARLRSMRSRLEADR
jgi:hypothetical protein